MSQKYRVIWRRVVIETQIAQFVVEAMQHDRDVNAITQAMNQIDQLLSIEPETRGESRGQFERILIVSPLVVTFEIHDEESVVVVLTGRYRPKPM